VFDLKMEVERQDRDLAVCQNNHDLLDDHMMDVEMSTKGAHTMIASMKEDVQELQTSVANPHDQVELIRSDNIAWCQARISKLEKPNNPTNKSLWQLVNQLSGRLKDQDDLIQGLQAGLVGAKDRVGVLEMSSLMIRSRVQVLEEAMEINPPVTDLSGDDSTDSEYADVDNGGAMLVDDSGDEKDQENVVPIPIPPPVIRIATPHPPTILRELIPIEEPAPVVPAVEVEEGEDDAWYIPLIIHRQIHALDEFTTAAVEPVPEYVEDRRDDPVVGPLQDDLPADGSEDELWANLGVHRRAGLAK
jgi:hypothetical protein